MDYLTDSLEEKPRMAPVPMTFSGGPTLSSVPDVSLVFSPLSLKSNDTSHTHANNGRLPPKGTPHNLTRPQVPKPQGAGVLFPSSSFKNTSTQYQHNEMQKSSLHHVHDNGTRLLQSVGAMATKIIAENSQSSQHNSSAYNERHKHSRSPIDDIRSECFSDNRITTQENYRYPTLPSSHSHNIGIERQVNLLPCKTSITKTRENSEEGCVLRQSTVLTNGKPTIHCVSESSVNQELENNFPVYSNSWQQSNNARCHVQNYGNHQCHANNCCGVIHDPNKDIASCSTASATIQTHVLDPSCSTCSNCINKSPYTLSAIRSNLLYNTNSNNQFCHVNNVRYGNTKVIPHDKDNFEVNDSNSLCFKRQGPHSRQEVVHHGVKDQKSHCTSGRENNLPKITNCKNSLGPGSPYLETLHEFTESVPSTSSINGGKENSEKHCLDTSLIREIALMNERQCTILQGLLQQVVAMQADQMKILGEINEKLSKANILGENITKTAVQDMTESKSVEVQNVTTQTTISEKFESNSETKKLNSKSFDTEMTSVNSNIPEHHFHNLEVNNSQQDYSHNIPVQGDKQDKEPYNPKIKKLQDHAVSWSGVETVESFTLHGVCVPTVVEQMPSSVHTMHLHMQDYHSSASFDSIGEQTHNYESEGDDKYVENKGSWTLYDNIVGHVKRFLQTAPCEKNNGIMPPKTSQVEAIRFATIEKIRQLGVSVYENSTEIKEVSAKGRIHFDPQVAHCPSFQYSPQGIENSSSDASLEIKTLALKYLSDDELCDLTKWNHDSKLNCAMKGGQRSANISLATQHYLEKYHLFPVGAENNQQMLECHNPNGAENNILDITTLKKQPKLL